MSQSYRFKFGILLSGRIGLRRSVGTASTRYGNKVLPVNTRNDKYLRNSFLYQECMPVLFCLPLMEVLIVSVVIRI